MDERRQYFRVPLALPVQARAGHDENRSHVGTSENVSARGVYFTCQTGGLHVGEQIDIRMNVPPAPGRASQVTSMHTQAMVLRVDPIDDGEPSERIGVACHFDDVPQVL